MANNNEITDANLDVPRGFLISLDDKGNYVPFLIKVRDKEILWSGSKNDEFYNELYEFMDNTGISTGEGMIGVPEKSFKKPDEKLVITISSNQSGDVYERFEIEPDGHFTGILRCNNITRFQTRSGTIFNTSCEIYSADFPLPFICETDRLSLVAGAFQISNHQPNQMPPFSRVYTKNTMTDDSIYSIQYTNHIVGEVYNVSGCYPTPRNFAVHMDGWIEFPQY